MSDTNLENDIGNSEPPDDQVHNAAIKVKAVFSNHFHINVMGSLTRIAFGEKHPGTDSNYHTSIVLPTAGAAHLGELLQRLIELNKAKVEDEAEKAD